MPFLNDQSRRLGTVRGNEKYQEPSFSARGEIMTTFWSYEIKCKECRYLKKSGTRQNAIELDPTFIILKCEKCGSYENDIYVKKRKVKHNY